MNRENVPKWSGNDKKAKLRKTNNNIVKWFAVCLCRNLQHVIHCWKARKTFFHLMVCATKNKTNFRIWVYCSANLIRICAVLKLQNLCKSPKQVENPNTHFGDYFRVPKKYKNTIIRASWKIDFLRGSSLRIRHWCFLFRIKNF